MKPESATHAPLALIFVSLGGCGPSTQETPASADPQPQHLSAGDSAPEGRPIRALQNRYEATLREREHYPDDPSVATHSQAFGQVTYDRVVLQRKEGFTFDVAFIPDGRAPEIRLLAVDLQVYMPGAPSWIHDDAYLTHLSVINQEWNRQQIRYTGERLEVTAGATREGDPGPEDAVVRVDLARNCLNAGLWEVVVFRVEAGESKQLYHGWFDFPMDLYAATFEHVNGLPYDRFASALEQWQDPSSDKVDFDRLRQLRDERTVAFSVQHGSLVPPRGAQAAKFRNIVSPPAPQSIQAMLSDATRFATFDRPGFYNRENPRETELGRLAQLDTVLLRNATSPAVSGTVQELEFVFRRKDTDERTRLILGGLALQSLPRLPVDRYHEGYKMPMGIANHTFYESYEDAIATPMERNPYYGFLVDQEGRFLDSHRIGIDGPLMHWDAEQPDLLRVYLLSFERHALVGHFEVIVPEAAVN